MRCRLRSRGSVLLIAIEAAPERLAEKQMPLIIGLRYLCEHASLAFAIFQGRTPHRAKPAPGLCTVRQLGNGAYACPTCVFSVCPMCGRFALKSPPERIRDQFGADVSGLEWNPHYNIGPMQFAPIVRYEHAHRRADLLRWGLIPSWAEDPSIGNRLINARGETVGEKPAFRSAFKARRCIVPADGFFEWTQQARGRQPYFIHRRDGGLLGMAGLWEHWAPPGGQSLATFTILTTEANAWMRNLHERMPVLLTQDEVEQWLDPATPPGDLQAMLRSRPEGELDAYPVTKAVGNVRNDRAAVLEPSADA